MKNIFRAAELAVLIIIFIISVPLQADEFEYPYYLIGSHNSKSECWSGIIPAGDSTLSLTVDPNKYLVGPPPFIGDSAITLPIDSWVELLFRGVIYDGPGDDIFISEIDPMGEQALIFLTDGAEQEYLLAFTEVPNYNIHQPTILSFDLAGLVIPFEPRAIRVVGIDLRGGEPGFDLSYVNARIFQDDTARATYPYPPDKAANVPVDAILDWITGNYSTNYNVYFGQDISSVYPNANAIESKNFNSFDPNILEMGKTYHWRIDHVNDTDPNIIIKGTPWSFKADDKLIIDNFDSYNSQNPLDESWIKEGDAYSYIATNTSYVYSCRQSLEVWYRYSSSSITLFSHTFEKSQNLKAAGAKTLELFFRGDAYNSITCNMYLTLNDGNNEARFMYNDTNDVLNEYWQLWRVDLQDTNQIDLSHIESISIGIEPDPNIADAHGQGAIYFDDIILYPSRCLDVNKPQTDLNCDCIVDSKDYSELANHWLESGQRMYQVQMPKNDPIFWYQFDDDITDTSGNVNGEYSDQILDFAPGVYGQAINFNTPGSHVEVNCVSQLMSEISEGITIAFWQKGEESPYLRDTLFCSEYNFEEYENKQDPAISINLGCWDGTGIYNWDCGTELPYDRRLSGKHKYKKEWSGQWNHWAFTKDIKTGTMQVFLNGELINSRTDSSKIISTFNSFTIGSGWYGNYDGLMDDLKIYNYALSQPEIAYIATNGTGIFDLPLMTPADLHPDNVIDFKDLMILANHWLENSLYPGE